MQLHTTSFWEKRVLALLPFTSIRHESGCYPSTLVLRVHHEGVDAMVFRDGPKVVFNWAYGGFTEHLSEICVQE